MQFSIAADVGNAQINLGKSSSNDFKIGNVCDLNVDYCNTLKKWNHTNVQQITNKMKKKKKSRSFEKYFQELHAFIWLVSVIPKHFEKKKRSSEIT